MILLKSEYVMSLKFFVFIFKKMSLYVGVFYVHVYSLLLMHEIKGSILQLYMNIMLSEDIRTRFCVPG
jgi:hypothetical protein